MFVEVHKCGDEDFYPVSIDMDRVKLIANHRIEFDREIIRVKETYEELKELFISRM